ncbi:nuclear transport factor 2 family protein [Streptomyces sp. NPDC050636]|uniref:nuclear transport factor 2 family protein n=1 Tax=Streptomyces sp. NPDC050636 TaxID=3154510 RepID=UPI0034231B01
MNLDTPIRSETDPVVFASLWQFYARQMHLLDSARVDEWAATLAPDCSFAEDGITELSFSATAIEGLERMKELAHRGVAEDRANGIVRRHWIGMLNVDSFADKTARTSFYAMVAVTEKGGESRLHSSAGRDLLVRGEAGWTVRERRVRRDLLG